jgi:hypothetical protein
MMSQACGLRPVCAALLGLALAGPVSASGDCIAVRGNIVNNVVGAGSTLGTARVRLDKDRFQCALRGDAKLPTDPNFPLRFEHTLVCDDNAGTPRNPVHSQLVLDTSGFPTTAPVQCSNGIRSFSFVEFSSPIPGSGTGRFQSVSGGQIIVEGTLFCTLAVDMEFSGQLCFQDP